MTTSPGKIEVAPLAERREQAIRLAQVSPPPSVAEELEAEDGAQPKRRARRPEFNAPKMARKLMALTPTATGGALIHAYRGGSYRPAEEYLRHRLIDELGDEWRRNRADEVLAYIADASPALWETESLPLDRVNTTSGIVDVKTQKLEPHDSSFLSPIQIAAPFNPAADCPRIKQFLGEVLAQDDRLIFYEWAGYVATPDNTLQRALMCAGEGAAGKSTLLAVIEALVGVENVSNVPLHRLEEDRFATAELYGRLVNTYADLPSRSLADSSVFKAITGGDRITAERKYAPAFGSRPYTRLQFSANEAPPTPDGTDAYFRRWLILPFERKFAGGSADRGLLAKLTTEGELSGLLNYALAALQELRSRGEFSRTPTTDAAAARFRTDADSVAGFFAECCAENPEARVERPRLFDAYRDWTTANNRRPLSRQRFNRRIETLAPGAAVQTFNGARCWVGIALEEGGNRG